MAKTVFYSYIDRFYLFGKSKSEREFAPFLVLHVTGFIRSINLVKVAAKTQWAAFCFWAGSSYLLGGINQRSREE